MRLLDGFSRAGAVRLTGVLVAAVAVAACCVGVSSAAAGVINTIPVGHAPTAVSSDGTHVWVANYSEDTVSEIEASSGGVIRTIPVGSHPSGVSADGTDVWVTNEGEDTVSEIEASSGDVIRTIPVGSNPRGVSSYGSEVWVTNYSEDTVSGIEASSGTVIATIPVGDGGPEGVASSERLLWVALSEGGSLWEGVESSVVVGVDPTGVSWDGTHVWVTSSGSNTVSELEEEEEEEGGVIRTIPVGHAPQGVSSDGTHVWAANSGEDTVTEIAASSGKVINTFAVGSYPRGVSSDGTHVWVTNFDENTVSEIATSYTPTCTGNTGKITLKPGLTDTAKVQTMKLRGTLTGCTGEPFTQGNYTATLKTAGPVSCSVLRTAGEPAAGSAKYKWTPPAKSTGRLSMPLTETPDIAFSAEVTGRSYKPLTLTGTATESYTGGAKCGEKVGEKVAKPVKTGKFSGVISGINP